MAKKICSTLECNLAPTTHGKCNNCYQRMYYWNDRSISDKLAHIKKMRRGEPLLEELMGNVKALKRA